MVDFILFRPGASVSGDVLWQSSLFLLIGLVASMALGRRPARAHGVLLLAIAGALITPLCSQFVHRAGWGLWVTSAPDAPLSLASSSRDASYYRAVTPSESTAVLQTATTVAPSPLAISPATARALRGERRLQGGESSLSERLNLRATAPIGLPRILTGLWWVLSGLCLARLIVSLVMGRRAVGRARPLTCDSMELAAAAACTRLGLRERPDLRTSSRVTCPAIWCWGRRPVIVLPEAIDALAAPVDWVGVFCHELAHWVRRDHWSSLLAEFMVCALPWHPLAWWARHRLGQLGELACDDWAIASGQEPAAYAETLLELVPRRRTLAALAAVSRRSGLFGRITYLLALNGPVQPRPGRGWSGAVSLVAIGLVAVIALAQVREGGARSDEVKKPDAAGQPAAALTPAGNQVTRRTVRGTVRDITGKPVSGVSIFAVGLLEQKPRTNGWYFTHHGDERQTLAQTSSDRDGKFILDLALDPAVLNVEVIARSAGMGLTARNFSARPDGDGRMFFKALDERSVNLTLAPNFPIEGRLLSQTGTPVSGASVALTVLELDETPDRDGFDLHAPEDGEGRPVHTPYWPEPVVTDAQGRFRLDGSAEKVVARIAVTHDHFIHEQLIISTESELGGYRQAWRIKPMLPRFTHVLAPARTIEGIVTDKRTGQQLASVHVEIGAMADDLNWPGYFSATTDAQGRYRITGVAWDNPRGLVAQLIPDATSGYLPAQHQLEGWPIGAADLRWNLTLKKGSLVRGRVIDGDSRRPIPGARVAGEMVSQTAITDQQGNFSLCIDPGYRSLFIEGPTPDYRRVTVQRGEVDRTDGIYHPHGYVRIAVTPEGTIAPVEVALKKGATIVAQAVDPEGKPLRNVWVGGESLFVQFNNSGAGRGLCSLGLYRAATFEPGRTYRAFFMQDDRHLAGFADLTAMSEPTEPVNVTLRATARVRGKLLRPDGTPDRRKGVTAYFLLTAADVKLDPMDFLRGDRISDYGMVTTSGGSDLRKTGDEGEFEVSDLMAGVRNYLTFSRLSSKEVQYIAIDPLRPGEVRDLGAIKPIVLAEQQP